MSLLEILETADDGLLSLLEAGDVNMSRVHDGIVTCSNMWAQYCKDYVSSDALNLENNSFTVDLFTTFLRKATQATDTATRISHYKILLLLSSTFIDSHKTAKKRNREMVDSVEEERQKFRKQIDDLKW